MLELGKRHEKGVKIISDKTPLTPREREIADRLYISEATVRTILRSVYSKLDIHSKIKLDTKKF